MPLVGNLFNVDVRNLSKSLTKLAKKYGDVFSLFVGRTPVVVLNDYDTIKKCFDKTEFSGRPGNFSGTFFQKGKTGISTTEGKYWTSQREFLMSHLAHLTGKLAQELPNRPFYYTKSFRSWSQESGGRGDGRGGGSQDLAPEEGGRAPCAELQTQHWHPQRALERDLRQVGDICTVSLFYSFMFRKLHAQQQEFQAVYECIDKLTQVSCCLGYCCWKFSIFLKSSCPGRLSSRLCQS